MRKSGIEIFGIVIAVMALASATSVSKAHAGSRTEARAVYGNITQNHIDIGASMNLSSIDIEGTEAYTVFTLSLRSHYYIIDRLGLGALFFLQTQSNLTNLRFGPSVIYYFWTSDRLGAYASQDLSFRSLTLGGATATTAFETDTAVGLNYFLTPAVAVGPAVEFFHRFGNSHTARINQVSFTGQFSIYL